MPALVATRHDPDLPTKIALTALMRKLIELANALVQQDRR